MTKLSFKANYINHIRPPDEGRRCYQDTVQPGLELWVSNTGRKVFYARSWDNSQGRSRRVKLGTYPGLGITEARKAAKAIISDIVLGKIAARTDLSHETKGLTIEKAFSQFINEHVRPRGSAKTLRNYEGIYKLDIEYFARRRLSTISRAAVDKWHIARRNEGGQLGADYKEDRLYAANRALTLLRAIFNHAIKTGRFTGANPCLGIQQFREQRRESYLTSEQVKAFYTAAVELRAKHNYPAYNALLTMLLTGARRSNVLTMEWTEIDFEQGIWTIPAKKYKSRKPHRVFLSRQMIEVLRQCRAVTQGRWVFQSGTSNLKDPRRQLKNILSKAGITAAITPHSLRHSFVTLCFELVQNPTLAARLAGHTLPGITARYGHLSDRQIADAYQAIADHITGAGEMVLRAVK